MCLKKLHFLCERIKSNFIENINFLTHFAASWILPHVEAAPLSPNYSPPYYRYTLTFIIIIFNMNFSLEKAVMGGFSLCK